MRRFSRHSLLEVVAGRLGPTLQRRVVELVAAELSSDLSLTRLAHEAGLSVHHFCRAFKATFGVTPHRYVQDRRLASAISALREDHRRPIADVAAACGFASQSHMTSLMRRRVGTTPRSVRIGR